MFSKLEREYNIYSSRKKIIKKAKVIGGNIILRDKVKINGNTYFGKNIELNGLTIREEGKITFGNNISIAKGCIIFTGGHDYKTGLPYGPIDKKYKDTVIEDNVWIGQNVIIIGGITIGEGAVIQAGSVVCFDVPPLAIIGGNPAKPFKYRNEEEYLKLKDEEKIFKFHNIKKHQMINITR